MGHRRPTANERCQTSARRVPAGVMYSLAMSGYGRFRCRSTDSRTSHTRFIGDGQSMQVVVIDLDARGRGGIWTNASSPTELLLDELSSLAHRSFDPAVDHERAGDVVDVAGHGRDAGALEDRRRWA